MFLFDKDARIQYAIIINIVPTGNKYRSFQALRKDKDSIMHPFLYFPMRDSPIEHKYQYTTL